MFNRTYGDDGIRTADLWCRKRPLCQPSHHNQCPLLELFQLKLFSNCHMTYKVDLKNKQRVKLTVWEWDNKVYEGWERKSIVGVYKTLAIFSYLRLSRWSIHCLFAALFWPRESGPRMSEPRNRRRLFPSPFRSVLGLAAASKNLTTLSWIRTGDGHIQ